ncbi:MAG: alpha/beta fold hydrolase [Clostridia bacterium]|nr:alpha/beta fold hydrolase [Clostridia bacterium]
MAIYEISFPSFNERDTVKGWIYTPVVPPKAIVQIVHGFGEHSRRYLHLILRMLDAGFVVCADDHVGHGVTAAAGNTWGDYGYKGYATTTEDEKTFHDLAVRQYPNLPYFMFGHSWGSMIARDFAVKHGDLLQGTIFCGTTALRENTLSLGKQLKALVDGGHGSEINPSLLEELLKDFNARYDEVKTPNDWIAADSNVVADHARDPLNNFHIPPNIQALYDFTQLWIDIGNEGWAAKVPDIPIYLIAGDQDPVGNYGEGVYQVANWLRKNGKKVKTRIYSGYRHEIHNEPPIRDEVEAGIIQFITDLL